MKLRRITAFALLGLSACGVPQEIYDTRARELDRCKTDLTRSQADYSATQKNADDLAGEASELRDRIATLESDRTRLSSTLSSQRQNLESFKNAATLADRRAELYELVVDKLQPLVNSKQVAIEIGKNRLLLRLPDAIVFEVGRGDLRVEGQSVLRDIAAVMKQVNRDFLVAVHNDNAPLPKGTLFKSGWELTTARAVAIVRFLQGEGVDPRHLGAAGYSEFNFLVDNADDSARAQNRRIELILMPTADELLPLPPDLGKRLMQRPAPRPSNPLPPPSSAN